MDGSASESSATPDLPAVADDSIAVLHVDDDPDFADLTAEFLERKRDTLRVETATSASEGLALAAEDDFDCIVSDYDMPEQDGIEFLRAVRQRFGDLPFILFTGKGSEEVASDAVAAGVTEYLQKDAGSDQYTLLANRIENAVSKRRAERDYRELFEKISDGIKIHDPETGRLLDVNRRFCEMLGYTREELLELPIEEFTHDDFTRADAQGRIERAAAGEPQVFECVNETKAGDPLPVEVHLTGTRIGGQRRVLAVVRDIRDQRERERILGETADRMRLAIQGANSWAWEWDLGEETIIQSAVTGILGVEDDEKTRSVDDFLRAIHPEDRDGFLAGRDEAIDGDGDYHNEFRLVQGDEVRWIESRGQVYRDDGDPDRIIGIATDVTERKEREREREWMQRALDQSSEAVVVSDPETAAIEFVNDTACEQLGYDRDELLDRTVIDIQPNLPDMAAWRDHVDDLRAEGHTLFEGEHVRSDGTRFPVEVNTGLIEIEGREYLLGIARDVTHRRERERELQRQIDRLEQVSEVISHDLRSPLNVAKGHLAILQDRNGSEELDAARSAIDRMEELIEEVATMAQAGRVGSETAPVALSTYVRECWASVRVGEAEVVVESDLDFEASPGRLRHLLENLFGNAVVHAGPGVTVRVGALDGGFYVADDGPGIPADEREDVFEPGYSTAERGTGLGLSIVRQMAEDHGWSVRVTESDAGGARFEITGVERVR